MFEKKSCPPVDPNFDPDDRWPPKKKEKKGDRIVTPPVLTVTGLYGVFAAAGITGYSFFRVPPGDPADRYSVHLCKKFCSSLGSPTNTEPSYRKSLPGFVTCFEPRPLLPNHGGESGRRLSTRPSVSNGDRSAFFFIGPFRFRPETTGTN